MKYEYFGSQVTAYVYQSLSGVAGGTTGVVASYRTVKFFVALLVILAQTIYVGVGSRACHVPPD
jgi:uncharacterized membrane protein (DUF4010 family)